MSTPSSSSPLKSLEKDLRYYNDSMHEIALEILSSNVSKFPVFVAHQHESSLGEVILDKNELGTDWTIQVATMETLIEKKVILPERQEYFELNYKDPRKFMCIFVVIPEGANIVFYPYQKS